MLPEWTFLILSFWLFQGTDDDCDELPPPPGLVEVTDNFSPTNGGQTGNSRLLVSPRPIVRKNLHNEIQVSEKETGNGSVEIKGEGPF